MKKEYVDNDVFRFRISLKEEFDSNEITVYTKPFPEPEEYTNECLTEYDKQEEIVKEKYFTQKRIDELKLKLIQRIQECKNPFYISCTDRDGGYNVTEDQLFNLEEND
jgi:hypothetical protein